MIPKIVHYIWLGGKPLPPMIKKCVDSWKKALPDYNIVCWDETNLDISDPIYLSTLKNKKWAFASDIARLHVLYKHGGIYLDTDMEIIKSLNPLLDTDLFIGMEDTKHINAAIIGCTSQNVFIKDALEAVKLSLLTSRTPIPQIITKVYALKQSQYQFNHKVYPSDFFYPYNPFVSEVKNLFYLDVTENTYAIHHWGHSWKNGIADKIIQKIKLISIKLFESKK